VTTHLQILFNYWHLLPFWQSLFNRQLLALIWWWHHNCSLDCIKGVCILRNQGLLNLGSQNIFACLHMILHRLLIYFSLVLALIGSFDMILNLIVSFLIIFMIFQDLWMNWFFLHTILFFIDILTLNNFLMFLSLFFNDLLLLNFQSLLWFDFDKLSFLFRRFFVLYLFFRYYFIRSGNNCFILIQ